MSSRGNGRGGKRKYSEHNSFNSKKRNYEEDFPRNERRLNNRFQYNSNNKRANYSSRNAVHSRNNYYRPNQYYNSGHNKYFGYPKSISTDSHIEQEEDVTGNSSLNAERQEKVLATKKRIEEAFASKSSSTSNQEMAFEKPVMKETSTDNKDKNSEGNLHPVDIGLRLTSSDFKEIGSVASGVEVAGETDASDLILNVASCASQQRSFDKICPPTLPSSSKQQRISGWNVTALNESETAPLYSNPRVVPPGASRPLREQYLQKSSEEILGSIETNTKNQSIINKKSKTGSSGNQKTPRTNTSRVGQLYQSFLRSRLFGGFALTLSNHTSKPAGPNPLLDKSVLESCNYKSSSESQTFQLEMPRPIIIKLEANKRTDLEKTPSNCMEAEEANEFCQEFSHLLAEPNYLIPAEELEKLGLGHLAEMNDLVNERRISNSSPNVSVNNESCLRVRSLNALNSVTENDITYNPVTSNVMTSSASEFPLINNFSNASQVQSEHQPMNYEFVNVPVITQAEMSGINPQLLTNPLSSTITQDPILHDIHTPVAERLSVESVAEKVINKLLSSTNINSQVLTPEFLLRNQFLQSNRLNNQNETSTPIINNSFGRSTDHINQDPTNQLEDIGSKVLRMFVIDKQIEGLRVEKMEIYKEILSIGEISSSLLNSWAQEKIQKRNPRNVPSEHPNDFTSNYHMNHLANTPSSISSFLTDAISQSVQSMVAESCSPNNLNHNASSTSGVPSSQSTERRHSNQLSVRTDLHDTNSPSLSNDLNVLNTHNKGGSELLKASATVKTEPSTEAVTENPLRKKIKKKKKGKHKETLEDIVYLIEDSSDEENCSVSVCSSGVGDPLANDSEPTIVNYDLKNTTPTCIYQYKGILVVGCKDGTLLVYDIQSTNVLFLRQIHEETVSCICVYMKQGIFGFTDGTMCVFSLEKQRKTQTIRTLSPVQCVEVRREQLYVGTKTGQLITYKMNAAEELSLKSPVTKKLSNSSIIALKVTEMEDEEVVIVACRGEQIAVYYTDSGKLLTTFDWCDTVHCLAVFNQSPLVYCGTNTQSIKVVNFVTGDNEPDCLVGIVRSITKIVIKSPILFAASTDGKVYIYDTKVNKLMSTLTACKGHIIGMQVYKKLLVVASNRCELNAVSLPLKVEALLRISAKSKSNS